MKNLTALFLCLVCVATVFTSRATDLKQAKVTQVVNEVRNHFRRQWKRESRRWLMTFSTYPTCCTPARNHERNWWQQDATVTRVGANTIFSFDPSSRTIDLKQGSLLFHSPHGKGGGTIHTGSATASVLGSTLIVCATPNGGFKVICLEDKAHIKLRNGLKQQLSPGQMTYILPGGKNLAPVIVFKLDDLIAHCLLVKGFTRPLPSLPLILNEVDKQTKLIKSGKATDTGLLAGNNASPYQVEVLDPNTIQSVVAPPKSSAAQVALDANATLDQSSLTDPNIPTPPARIFLDPTFTLAGNKFFAGRSFSGFAAHNILFNPTAAQSAVLALDLSPFAGIHEFDFVATDDINIQGSVTFSGLSSQSRLSLTAGNQMAFAPGITLVANVADFELASLGVLSLDGFTILNNVGNVKLASSSAIDLNNIVILNYGQMILTAPNAINLTWGGEVSLYKIGPTGYNILTTDANKGSVNVTSKNGSLSVTDTSIQAHYLTLNSGDSILLDASGQTLKASGSGSTVNFTAPNLLTVNNADLSAYEMVNLVGNTITINGVKFGGKSIDNFGTQKGQVNVNGTQIPGGLNVYNSHYGATAITSANQIHLSSGPGSTPGMYSYAHP